MIQSLPGRNQLLSSVYKVPVELPRALGVLSRCCLPRRGGSSRQSDILVSWRADMALSKLSF